MDRQRERLNEFEQQRAARPAPADAREESRCRNCGLIHAATEEYCRGLDKRPEK